MTNQNNKIQDYLKKQIRMSIDSKMLETLKAVSDRDFAILEGNTKDVAVSLDMCDQLLGIPGVGVVDMTEEAYQRLKDKISIDSRLLIEEYLPEGECGVQSILPYFTLGDKGIGVEENFQSLGPKKFEEEDAFTFTLSIDTKEDSKKILFGEDPSLLIWAGLSYVYLDYDENKFYDELFKNLT